MSYKKGARREHELIEELEKREYACTRSAGSGKGGKKADGEEREQPDVLAGNGDNFYAFESKSSTRDNHIYIDEDEIEDLKYFSTNFGAKPRIGARFDYNDFAFFKPSELHQTESGNYRVKLEDVEDAETIKDLA